MREDRAHLHLKFDGPEVADHAIDVNDLAPALMEWASALAIVSEEVAPSNPAARLIITPDAAKAGSFLLEMNVELPGLIEQAVGIFNSKEAAAAGTASSIATALIASVAYVYRKAKKSSKDDKLAEAIGTNPRFVAAVQKATRPLEKEGFTEISLSIPNGASRKVTITTEEHHAVEQASQDKMFVREIVQQVTVTIENLDFHEGKVWKLDDGDRTFNAAMRDGDFQSKIDRGEVSFSKSDMMDIDLLIKVYQLKSGRLRNERYIAKVHRHYTFGQDQLPIDE